LLLTSDSIQLANVLQPGQYELVHNGQTLDAKTRKTLQN
jgi:hypothetical protein